MRSAAYKEVRGMQDSLAVCVFKGEVKVAFSQQLPLHAASYTAAHD